MTQRIRADKGGRTFSVEETVASPGTHYQIPTCAAVRAAVVALMGAASGIATLDSNGKLTSTQIPALALVNTSVVASEVAMLALTAEVGDVAIRSDLNKSYILATAGATVLANWKELLHPGSYGLAHIADVALSTQAALTVTSMTGTANAAPAAETNVNALTITAMTGTANTAPAAETNVNTIAVNSVGTPSSSTMATVTQAGNSGSADLAPVQDNFATLATELATQKALNTVLINNAKTWATELATQKALNTVLINNCKTFATRLGEAKADSDAQVTTVNLILARLEAAGISLTA